MRTLKTLSVALALASASTLMAASASAKPADVAAAEAWRILTTPTVVKDHPPPARRVTGDLSDPERVWTLLDVEGGPS